MIKYIIQQSPLLKSLIITILSLSSVKAMTSQVCLNSEKSFQTHLIRVINKSSYDLKKTIQCVKGKSNNQSCIASQKNHLQDLNSIRKDIKEIYNLLITKWIDHESLSNKDIKTSCFKNNLFLKNNIRVLNILPHKPHCTALATKWSHEQDRYITNYLNNSEKNTNKQSKQNLRVKDFYQSPLKKITPNNLIYQQDYEEKALSTELAKLYEKMMASSQELKETITGYHNFELYKNYYFQNQFSQYVKSLSRNQRETALSCREKTGLFKDCELFLYFPIHSLRCYSRAWQLVLEFAPIAPIIDTFFGIDQINTGEFIGLSTKKEAHEKRVQMITNASLGTFTLFSGIASFITQRSVKLLDKGSALLNHKKPLITNKRAHIISSINHSDELLTNTSNKIISSAQSAQKEMDLLFTKYQNIDLSGKLGDRVKIIRELKKVNNNYVEQLQVDFAEIGYATRVVDSPSEKGVKVLELLDSPLNNKMSKELSFLNKAKRKFQLDQLTISLYENTMINSLGFHLEGRIELGTSTIKSILNNSKSRVNRHELRHAFFNAKLNNNVTSPFHQSFLASNGQRLGVSTKSYDDFFSAEEIYTFSNDLSYLSKKILLNGKSKIDENYKIIEFMKENLSIVKSISLATANLSKKSQSIIIKSLEELEIQKFITHDPQEILEKIGIGVYRDGIRVTHTNGTSHIMSIAIKDLDKMPIKDILLKALEMQKSLIKIADHQAFQSTELLKRIDSKYLPTDLSLQKDFAKRNIQLAKELNENYKGYVGQPN